MKKQGISHFTPEVELQFDLAAEMQPFIDAERGKGPISEMIELRVWEVVELLAKLIASETPVNLGNLAGAIAQSGDVSYGDKGWYGEVAAGGIKYATPVEFGVRPFTSGKGPGREMLMALELWFVRKQITWYDKQGNEMTPNQMAWALAWSIAKKGTEGKLMFLKGVRQAKPHVDSIMNDLMGDVAAYWGARQP